MLDLMCLVPHLAFTTYSDIDNIACCQLTGFVEQRLRTIAQCLSKLAKVLYEWLRALLFMSIELRFRARDE